MLVIVPLVALSLGFEEWLLALALVAVPVAYRISTRIGERRSQQRNNKLEQLVESRAGELIKINSELEASKQSLEKSLRVRNKLISILSHEIITPLRFIGLSAKLARNEQPTQADDLINTLADIQNAAAKLHSNASNILNWMKTQGHQIEVKPVHVSPLALVDELLDSMRELGGLHETRLVNSVPEDDILYTDPQILRIILHNMLSNAIKHTRNGTIVVFAAESKSDYKIIVADSGDGISDEMLQRINVAPLDQLISSDHENGLSGSGLGYVLVNDLIKMLNGSYSVNSEVGKGTVVEIVLPAAVTDGAQTIV